MKAYLFVLAFLCIILVFSLVLNRILLSISTAKSCSRPILFKLIAIAIYYKCQGTYYRRILTNITVLDYKKNWLITAENTAETSLILLRSKFYIYYDLIHVKMLLITVVNRLLWSKLGLNSSLVLRSNSRIEITYNCCFLSRKLALLNWPPNLFAMRLTHLQAHIIVIC